MVFRYPEQNIFPLSRALNIFLIGSAGALPTIYVRSGEVDTRIKLLRPERSFRMINDHSGKDKLQKSEEDKKIYKKINIVCEWIFFFNEKVALSLNKAI